MRITKRQLEQIIQEELENLLYEDEGELAPFQRDPKDLTATSMADIKKGVAHARKTGTTGPHGARGESFSSYSGVPGTTGMRHKTDFAVMTPAQRAAMQVRKAQPGYKAGAAKARAKRDLKRKVRAKRDLKRKVEEQLEIILKGRPPS